MYFLLGICLIFAFLLTLNLLASVSASVLWRAISGRAARLSSRKQEHIIFGLRVFPVGAALIFVVAFLVPAYVLFEPVSSGETVSLKLALVSLASLLGIGIAAFRVFRTWHSTRALTSNWLNHSEPIVVEGVKIPVFRIFRPFPVIAVVGMIRPRMFVASQIFDSLSDDEFRAAIAHEYGHLHAHDNFKRAFLRVCRDMLIFPLGRELDRAWADNTESAADEYAAETGVDSTALDLAATLIKIARIAPENAKPGMPLGSFLIEGNAGDLRQRVRRLVALSDRRNTSATGSGLVARRFIWLYAAVVAAVTLSLASNTSLLLAIHNLSESVVAILQ